MIEILDFHSFPHLFMCVHTQCMCQCKISNDQYQYKNLSGLVSSLSLQASRECQSKVKLLEQTFRLAFREFQQWLVSARINTAKCFDVPQNVSEASSSLLKIQVQPTNPGRFRYRRFFLTSIC